jgi:hypothetical protein
MTGKRSRSCEKLRLSKPAFQTTNNPPMTAKRNREVAQKQSTIKALVFKEHRPVAVRHFGRNTGHRSSGCVGSWNQPLS